MSAILTVLAAILAAYAVVVIGALTAGAMLALATAFIGRSDSQPHQNSQNASEGLVLRFPVGGRLRARP